MVIWYHLFGMPVDCISGVKLLDIPNKYTSVVELLGIPNNCIVWVSLVRVVGLNYYSDSLKWYNRCDLGTVPLRRFLNQASRLLTLRTDLKTLNFKNRS